MVGIRCDLEDMGDVEGAEGDGGGIFGEVEGAASRGYGGGGCAVSETVGRAGCVEFFVGKSEDERVEERAEAKNRSSLRESAIE